MFGKHVFQNKYFKVLRIFALENVTKLQNKFGLWKIKTQKWLFIRIKPFRNKAFPSALKCSQNAGKLHSESSKFQIFLGDPSNGAGKLPSESTFQIFLEEHVLKAP